MVYVPGARPAGFTANCVFTGVVPTITKLGDVNQLGRGVASSNNSIAPGLDDPMTRLCGAGELPFCTALKVRLAVTGDTVRLTANLRMLVEVTSTVPVYVPTDKVEGITEMVNVAGVTLLLNDAEIQGCPLVETVNLFGANCVVIDHCCAGGTLPPTAYVKFAGVWAKAANAERQRNEIILVGRILRIQWSGATPVVSTDFTKALNRRIVFIRKSMISYFNI